MKRMLAILLCLVFFPSISTASALSLRPTSSRLIDLHKRISSLTSTPVPAQSLAEYKAYVACTTEGEEEILTSEPLYIDPATIGEYEISLDIVSLTDKIYETQNLRIDRDGETIANHPDWALTLEPDATHTVSVDMDVMDMGTHTYAWYIDEKLVASCESSLFADEQFETVTYTPFLSMLVDEEYVDLETDTLSASAQELENYGLSLSIDNLLPEDVVLHNLRVTRNGVTILEDSSWEITVGGNILHTVSFSLDEGDLGSNEYIWYIDDCEVAWHTVHVSTID